MGIILFCLFFFSSRRRHTRWTGDWSSDVCSSDLLGALQRAGSIRDRGVGVLGDRVAVRPAGAEDDVMAGPGERSAQGATDVAGADDGDLHVCPLRRVRYGRSAPFGGLRPN